MPFVLFFVVFSDYGSRIFLCGFANVGNLF